jgi:hypothetical protein
LIGTVSSPGGRTSARGVLPISAHTTQEWLKTEATRQQHEIDGMHRQLERQDAKLLELESRLKKSSPSK